jgi:hypothetical protein
MISAGIMGGLPTLRGNALRLHYRIAYAAARNCPLAEPSSSPIAKEF